MEEVVPKPLCVTPGHHNSRPPRSTRVQPPRPRKKHRLPKRCGPGEAGPGDRTGTDQKEVLIGNNDECPMFRARTRRYRALLLEMLRCC